MKHLLLFPLMGIAVLPLSNPITTSPASFQHSKQLQLPPDLVLSPSLEYTSQKMAAAVFKAQEFCRVEMKDFDFDAHFIVKSATVYFSGANFPQAVKGTINSTSLKPISSLMKKCGPGSVIMFDDIRVIGPDNLPRVIPGITITLF